MYLKKVLNFQLIFFNVPTFVIKNCTINYTLFFEVFIHKIRRFMFLTILLCISIIFVILLRVPNKYETGFSKNLLQSVSGNSSSPKNMRKQFDSFIWILIVSFLGEYIIQNFLFNN